MLTDWYFCSALRLTIHQSAEYLDIVDILRSPLSDGRQLGAALDSLARCETALRLHALRPLLASAERLRLDPALVQRAENIYADILEVASRDPDESTGPGVHQELALLLKEAVRGPQKNFAERLLLKLEGIPPRTGRRGASVRPSVPYQDLHEQAVETVGLTLLELAAREDPGSVTPACVGAGRLAVLDDALGNSLGRLPLLLAAAVLRRAAAEQTGSEVRERLAEAGRGAGDLEPDLLDTLARSWFGHPGDQVGPEPAVLETEIAGGRLYQLWPARDPNATDQRASVRFRLGIGSIPDSMARTVLWQLVLWELAAEHRPADTAALTARWWGPPADRRDQRPGDAPLAVPLLDPADGRAAGAWLIGAARLHWKPSGAERSRIRVVGVGNDDGRPPRAACSPWLDRKSDQFGPVSHIPPTDRVKRSWYRGAGQPLLLFQLMVVSAASVRLLRVLGAGTAAATTQPMADEQAARPDHLVALLFHAKDVLTDARFRFFLQDLKAGAARPADLPVTPAMAALTLHVLHVVDRAGKGTYPEIPPALFADFILGGPGNVSPGRRVQPYSEAGPPLAGEQWERLFRTAALQGVRQWIEERSAGVWHADRATGWFDGPFPYARRVLAEISRRLQDLDPSGRSALASVQLLRRNFPGAQVIADVNWIPQLPDMVNDYNRRLEEVAQHKGAPAEAREPQSRLTWRLLLAADPYPVELWERHSWDIELLTPRNPHRQARATIRLAAMLKETEPGDYDDFPEWIDEWLDLMAAINQPMQWARQIRGAAIDLFRVPAGRPSAQERMRRILEVVVDSIVEFSDGAPRYYQQLLDELAGSSGPLHQEGMNRLRARVVDAIRRHQVLSGLGSTEPPRLWTTLNAQESRQEIDGAVRRFVAAVSSTGLAWNEQETLGRAFVRSWRECAMTSPDGRVLRLTGVNGSASPQEAPDPRVVSARILDRFTGTEQVVLLASAVAMREDGALIPDLLPLSPTERKSRLAKWRRYENERSAFGIVCAVDADNLTGRTVLVNWAAEEPLEVVIDAGPGRRPLPGDPCVVAVKWNQKTGRFEPRGPRALSAAAWPAPQADEIRSASVSVAGFAGELRVSVAGVVRRNTLPRDDDGIAEMVLRHWDPDVSRALTESQVQDSEPTLARWDADLEHWVPADRTLTELIADDLPYTGPDECPATVLVFVGYGRPNQPQESGCWRFATVPGRSFLLRPADWADSPAALHEVLEHGPGVLVYAGLAGGPDPRLTLLHGPPSGAEERWPALAADRSYDTRNIDWLELFSGAEERSWQASLREGTWTADVSHAPRYPVGAGFPHLVTVSGLDSTARGNSCAFRPEPWTATAARRLQAAGEPLSEDSLLNPNERTAERFSALRNLARGTMLPLTRFRGGRRVEGNWVAAVVGDGIVVQVERDSLLYARPPATAAGLPPMVEITKVSPPSRDSRVLPPAAPIPASELVSRLDQWTPDAVPSVPEDMIEGVVVTIYRDAGERSLFGVWLNLQEVPWYCELPVGCFSTTPREIGETFTGRRHGDSWAFVPDKRQVLARALHRLRFADSVPKGGWDLHGWFQDQGRWHALYARPDGGELLAVPDARRSGPPAGQDGTLVLRLGGAPARHGERFIRGLVRAGRTEVAGNAPEAAPVPGAVDRVSLHVRQLTNDLVSIRRDFTIRAGAAARPDPAAPVQPAGDGWLEEIRAGEQVQVSGRLRSEVLEVGGIRVPLLDGDEPYVAGVTYSDTDVTALLVERDTTLFAATALAPPRSAEEFAAAVAGIAQGEVADRYRLQRHVYYVGTEQVGPDTLRRLEWGRGHTVLLGAAELTVNGEPCPEEQAFPLFHGDRLTHADFRTGADGRASINIRPEYIEIQTAGKVARERDDHIVHRLTVQADPAAGRVLIKQVQLRRSSRVADQSDQSWREDIAAHLHPDSVREVLATVATQRSPADLGVLEIMARFDSDAYRSQRGRFRQFRYVGSQLADAEERGVTSGEHLFMVAGEITRPGGNDTYIEFHLPDTVLREPGSSPLSVRVGRKQFSCREYLLPQLFDEERTTFYLDKAVMLVQVNYDLRDGRWYGDLTRPPARSAEILRGAVTQAGGSLLAAFTDNGGRRVELRPGVVCELPETEGPGYVRRAGRGALVRISRGAGRMRLALAQPSDRSYIPDGGRPAVVLPKASLFGSNGLSRADQRGMFTVAGLPGVSVTATAEYGASLLSTPHPKLAVISTADRDILAAPAGDIPVRAATVDTEGDTPVATAAGPAGRREPAGFPGQPGDGTFALPWDQLSFTDADAAYLRRQAGLPWSYHDARTGHFANGSARSDHDIRHRTLASEPVFFDETDAGWTLRYSAASISLFGIPASTLSERRAPESEPTSAWYTVAYPATTPGSRTPSGLWIEISPGRVVEVGGPLLIGPQSVPLEELVWSRFGTGDRIRLELVQGDVTEPHLLRLLAWQPSPRSALLPDRPAPGEPGPGRTLLPLRTVYRNRGGLLLGAGSYQIPYPVASATLEDPAVSAVWLDRANHVTPHRGEPPVPGDTALLAAWDDGTLHLLGLPGYRVALSGDSAHWPGARWLASSLRGTNPADVLASLGGALPVTVDELDDGTVLVSRRRQPDGSWPSLGLLRTTAIAALEDSVVLRSGGALHCSPVSDVIAGLPAGHARAAAQALAAGSLVVWCHFPEQYAHAGIAVAADRNRYGRPQHNRPATRLPVQVELVSHPDEYDALPVAVLGSASHATGLIVRAVHDQGYRWMPADQASWLDQPTVEELQTYLVDPGEPIRIREGQDGSVSVVRVRYTRSVRKSMSLGATLRIEPVGGRPADDGRHLVIARVCPDLALIRLTAKPDEYQVGEPMLAEVAELGAAPSPAVGMVIEGARLHAVDLPARLAEGSATVAAQAHDQVAAQHSHWWNEGLPASDTPLADEAEMLIRAAGTASRLDGGQVPGAPDVLRRWLAIHGSAAFNIDLGQEMELGPLLAACSFMAELGLDDALLAKGAVLLTHQTALRATRSQHVELMVRYWLAAGRAGTQIPLASPQARLARLEFPAELDSRQLREALYFGHGILGRVDDGTMKDRFGPAALAVLAAVGQLPPRADLALGAEILSRLAGLGRALHPPTAAPTAQVALVRAQRTELATLLRNTIELPLVLLPTSTRIRGEKFVLAHKVLQHVTGI